jgi:Leucine-rich repeat (LRR) protein
MIFYFKVKYEIYLFSFGLSKLQFYIFKMEYVVNRNIESLEEIINEVPRDCNTLICNNKGLRSLRGIDSLPQITTLFVDNNQITSLEHIAGSNVTHLFIRNNQITSLEHIAGSNVTHLFIRNNQITSLEHIVGSNVTHLFIDNNQIKSLEYIVGSNVTDLYIKNNQIESLQGIVGSNVKLLYIENNPCYSEFFELESSIKKVKERYSFLDVKDPGFE